MLVLIRPSLSRHIRLFIFLRKSRLSSTRLSAFSILFSRVSTEKKQTKQTARLPLPPTPPPFLATFMRIALDYVRKCLRAAGDVR